MIGKYNMQLVNREVLSWGFKIAEKENLSSFALNPMKMRTEIKFSITRLESKVFNDFAKWANERYARYEVIDHTWFHVIEVARMMGDNTVRRVTFPNAYLISYKEDFSEDPDKVIGTLIVGQPDNLARNVRINKIWYDEVAEAEAWDRERAEIQLMPDNFLLTGAVSGVIKKLAPQAVPKAKTLLERAMKNIGLPFNLTRMQTKGVHRQLERIANGSFYVGSTTIKHEDAQRLIEELKRIGGMIVDPTTGKYVLKEGAIGNAALQRLQNNAHGKSVDSARERGEPRENHRETQLTDEKRRLSGTGIPNSSEDLLKPDGKIKQRRYYGPDGKAQEDIDYDHPNEDGTHIFPHRHEFDWTKNPPRQKSK